MPNPYFATYTFSKLIDDASSVFAQTIFTGPVLDNTGAADAFNRHLWQIAGLIRVQAGDTVAVRQATNLNANPGLCGPAAEQNR